MSIFKEYSIKIRNYKCFGETEQGMDVIKHINLIVGRNNSGKSTLWEMIEYGTENLNIPADLGHKGQEPKLIISNLLIENEILRAFPEQMSGGGIPGRDHWDYGKRWVGQPITWELGVRGERKFVAIDPPNTVQHAVPKLEQIVRDTVNPLASFLFKRLSSERDIKMEPENDSLDIDSNGVGLEFG